MEFCKTIKPLTGECDWAIWKRKVKDLLDFYEGALDVVSRKITKPEPLKEGATEAVVKDYNTRSAFYRKTNGLAKTLIASTISDEIYMKVMDKESAADVWETLHQQFEATSKDQLFKMCTELFSFEWVENLDVSTHISKLKSLWTEINAGLELKGNQKLPELLLICKILHVLPSSFKMFKSSWMMITRDEDKSLDELIMQLCLYERNFKKPGDVGDQEALVINEKYSKIKNASSKKDSICHYCKKKGHWIKECRKWIADGKPSKSQQVKNHTHVALHAMSNEVNIADSSLEWWFDNGATKHVTNSDKYFVEYEEFEQPNSIQSAGKECLKAIGKGKIEMLSKVNNKERIVTLNDVWYVPTISRNLFSILAAHDRNPNSKFTSTTKECKMYIDGELVVHGQREINGSLYKLNVRPNSHTQITSLLEEKSVLQLYHERWGHQDYRHVKMKLQKDMGISVKNTNEHCEPCIFGKSSRKPFGRREAASEPGEIVSTDVCGPFPPSFRGYRYLVVFKDHYTKYRYGYFLKQKSEVKDSLKEMLIHAKCQGHTVKTLISDNGGEFDNDDVRKILAQHGVTYKLTAPYTPQQNGCAERENRTIVEMARTFKYANKDIEFPESLWCEFVKSAIYILNRTGKSSEADISPFEKWYGKKPRIRHLRIIASTCYMHIPSQKRKKMDKKAEKGYLVGYDGDERYRIYIPERKDVRVSRDVKFVEKTNNNRLEEKSPIKSNVNPGAQRIDLSKIRRFNDLIQDGEIQNEEPDINIEPQDDQLAKDSPNLEEQNYDPTSNNPEGNLERNEKSDSEFEDALSGSNDRQESEEENCNYRKLRNRKVIISKTTHDELAMISQEFVNSIETPNSYSEATKGDQRSEWLAAMEKEMNSLIENKTWVLTELPKGAKALPSKWVYKVKTKADGSVDTFKARLVIKGYNQTKGLDYDQTFSPVARMSTIRSLLSVAVTENIHLAQFDVSTAFLYGELDETIFMKQPKGFDDGTNRVCSLKRSLYGLKQAPRCWNTRMRNFLTKLGFKTSSADCCLYTREKHGKKVILALYVDDGLVAASDFKDLKIFLDELKAEFKITQKYADYFLGLEIKRSDDSVKISQKSYAKKILEKFNFSECRAVSTPMENIATVVEVQKSTNDFPYRQAVGAIMYLMLGTRPDLAFSVGVLSRALESPTSEDVQRLKRVLRYIAGTLDYGIIYKTNGEKKLECYSDADYGGCTSTGRSTTGVVACYAGSPISWISQRQPTVSTSTTEAEIIAASEAAKELMWLKSLFNDLTNYNEVPVIHIDNTAAIRLSQNPEFHKRTKHISLKHFFIREKVIEGEVSVSQISTEYQIADMMTKPLPKLRLHHFINLLNINYLNKGKC